MIFNLLLLALVGTVAYFHYTQGFFSAALSTIFVVVAAMMAISYHETLATYIVPKMPDWAVAVSLVGIFFVVYVLLRVIFDKLVPGNIRFPLMVDKVGAGVLGVIAGLFATGVLALAGESMQFGPTIGGYSRAELKGTSEVTISAARSNFQYGIDSAVYNVLVGDTVDDPAHLQPLWLHQDDLVCWLAQRLSSGGAMDNGIALSMVHPDYPTELFADQLGVQIGAVHAAPVDSSGDLPLKGCFLFAPRTRFDPVLPDARLQPYKLPDLDFTDHTRRFLDVAVDMTATPLRDSDGLVRFGLANVRLVAGGVDNYPVGTLGDKFQLMEARPDDPCFVDPSKGGTVVFVFYVDPQVVFLPSKSKQLQFVPGAFIQAKRFARVGLTTVGTLPDFIRSTHFPGKASDEEYGGMLARPWVIQNLDKLTQPMPGT